MTESPNALAATADFEFSALAEALNYRAALFSEFGPHLRGEILEVGAGVGQMTEGLVALPEVKRVVSVEPDASFCARHRAHLPGHELLEGTTVQLPPGRAYDAVFCINVLEHIREDSEELQRYATLLNPRHGALCLFVPARPELYSPIDKDFGHHRRYTRAELRQKLVQSGFRIERLCYFNWVGYFLWWFNFCLLKKRSFEVNKVRLFDRVIFPWTHGFEAKVLRPPFGQSLLAVARA